MEQQTEKNTAKPKKRARQINTNIDVRFQPAVKRVLYLIAATLVLISIIHQIFLRYKPQKLLVTQPAIMRSVYSSIDTKAYIMRSETVLPSAGGATVVPRIENGGKVSVGDTVADIYSSEVAASTASLLPALEKKLDYYSDINDALSMSFLSNINMYDSAVLDSVISLKKSILAGETHSLLDESYYFGENITMRQIAVGKKVDVSASIAAVSDEIAKIKESSAIKSSVKADASGFFVNTIDGYESVGDFSTVKTIAYEGVEALLNAPPVTTEKSRVGKLVNSFVWYIVCNIPDHDAEVLNVRDFVTISIDGYGTLKVRTASKNPNTNGYTTLVFSCNEMNNELSLLRKVDIKIHINEYSGYEIPLKALRTVDGVKGVYVQFNNVVRFRKVDIVYSDDSVILSKKADTSGYVSLYDEIVVEGTDLYDRKIID